MSKLQEIRDALQKYAADEAECHVRGMIHIPKTACDALATLDALMETHALVAKEIVNLWNNTTDQQDINADLLEALKEAQAAMANAFNRIHCLPRTTDTQIASQLDGCLAKARKAISRAEQKQMEKK